MEALVGVFAEGTGSGFHVLLGQGGGDVGRHQAVLGHHVGLEPHAHGVVGTKGEHVAHTIDTLEFGHHVDFHVVIDKFGIVLAGFIYQCHSHQHGGLALLGDNAHLVNLRGQEVGSLRHAVLHVHSGHVGVEALAEGDFDGGITGVGCGRGDVLHALGTVDGFFQRLNHGVEHGLSVSAGVGGLHLHGRGRNVGVLCDRQSGNADDT